MPYSVSNVLWNEPTLSRGDKSAPPLSSAEGLTFTNTHLTFTLRRNSTWGFGSPLQTWLQHHVCIQIRIWEIMIQLVRNLPTRDGKGKAFPLSSPRWVASHRNRHKSSCITHRHSDLPIILHHCLRPRKVSEDIKSVCKLKQRKGFGNFPTETC